MIGNYALSDSWSVVSTPSVRIYGKLAWRISPILVRCSRDHKHCHASLNARWFMPGAASPLWVPMLPKHKPGQYRDLHWLEQVLTILKMYTAFGASSLGKKPIWRTSFRVLRVMWHELCPYLWRVLFGISYRMGLFGNLFGPFRSFSVSFRSFSVSFRSFSVLFGPFRSFSVFIATDLCVLCFSGAEYHRVYNLLLTRKQTTVLGDPYLN